MQTLIQDFRYGLRMLLKNPGFTLIAVMTLALGIGANTAIFGVVNAVLFRPLPYLDEERLVVVESGNREKGRETFSGASPADFKDWKEQSQSFEQLAAFRGDSLGLTGVENPDTFRAARVTTNFFQLSSVRPLLGRAFRLEDGTTKAPGTVVLSHRLWQSRFGGDPAIVGRTLGNTGVMVIGVMPPDFKLPDYAECWLPFNLDSGEMRYRSERYFNVFGLLKPGATITSAQAEMKTIAARLEAQYPNSNKMITAQLSPFRERFARDVKKSLLIMLGAIGMVLLIACANVANLLLARAVERRKEMAIRLALGAGRLRLLRQMLLESCLLSLLGAGLGLMIAVWGTDVLVTILPKSYNYLLLQDQTRLDGRVLSFTLVLALLNGIVFGLIPALQTVGRDANEWLKDSGSVSRSSGSLQQQRTRSALVVAEIAIALVLLIGAGLLIQSFVRLQKLELGLDPHNVASINIGIPSQDTASKALFVKRMQESAAAVPGVESVAVASGQVFPYLNFPFNIEGRPMASDAVVLYEAISPNYFRALKARMLAGREFTELDNHSSPPVAIINETLARQFFSAENPIGKVISLNYMGSRPRREIVGIVRDMNQGGLGRIEPQIYVPYFQQPWLGAALIVRASGNPEFISKELQRAIWSIDPKQGVTKLVSGEEMLRNSLSEPRLYTVLLGLFAALALLLAALGIYGVISYSVSQRTHEIGIRMALGARPRDVLNLVIRQGMMLTLIGVAIGVIAALALTRLMVSLLFGVSASDPATFLVIALLLTIVALLACYVPARRATKVDPMVALRYE